MRKLQEVFTKAFGIPIPQQLSYPEELFAFDGQLDEATIVVSEIAKQQPFFVQGAISQFLSEAPVGYFLMGFWGHGVNSYAFYYQIVEDWCKVFFRLPYGGVYMDNKEMAARIREFLTGYANFLPVIKSRVQHFTAVDSMWEGNYTLITTGGEKKTHTESLFYDTDFENKLGSLLNTKVETEQWKTPPVPPPSIPPI